MLRIRSVVLFLFTHLLAGINSILKRRKPWHLREVQHAYIYISSSESVLYKFIILFSCDRCLPLFLSLPLSHILCLFFCISLGRSLSVSVSAGCNMLSLFLLAPSPFHALSKVTKAFSAFVWLGKTGGKLRKLGGRVAAAGWLRLWRQRDSCM